MLTALNKDGKQVTPSLLAREKLQQLRKIKEYYCPECKEKVIFRCGVKTTPHFAHFRKTNCLSATGEGPYHETGKLQLYIWLKRQKIKVELEKYLPAVSRRPDIYFTYQNKQFVIEFQCVRIADAELVARTAAYRQMHITPIWILGEQLLQRKSTYHCRVDYFTSLCQHQWQPRFQPVIYYYCPIKQTLIMTNQVTMINKSSALATFTVKSLDTMSFPHLFNQKNFSRKQIFTLWRTEKRKFRLTGGRRVGEELAWRTWLYEKGYAKDYLPSIIYIPTIYTQQMSVAPWNWQSRWVLDFFMGLPINTVFSRKQAFDVLQPYMNPIYFPLIHSLYHPIDQYIQYLIYLRYIVKENEAAYRKVKQPLCYDHIEDALNGDDELLRRFMYNNK